MPMQPSPRAETFRLLFPSVRFCMCLVSCSAGGLFGRSANIANFSKKVEMLIGQCSGCSEVLGVEVCQFGDHLRHELRPVVQVDMGGAGDDEQFLGPLSLRDGLLADVPRVRV